jgi:hypothetical protein
MKFGPTADPDNAEIAKSALAGFLDAMNTMIYWQTPDQAEAAAFSVRDDVKDMADHLYASAPGWKHGAWILQNMWHGFPDPAEFVFLGFDAQGVVNAMGYFEDWPSYWHKTENRT